MLKKTAIAFFLALFYAGSMLAGSAWAVDSDKATQAAIKAAHKMLDEFDGFKDSPQFRQCGFGCGDDNPGKKWAAKCGTLEAKSKQEGASMPVYTTFIYMRTMGKDYSLGKLEDAAAMRRMIEDTLRDYAE